MKLEEIKRPKLIETGKWMSVFSAAIGTIILLAFFALKVDVLMFIGLFYIYFATAINGIFFLILFFECFRQQDHWRKIAAIMFFMLLNIPLSIFYCFLALNFNH
ncbi:hypothetical protein EZ456_14655 [Pedobacter psychrodurus]|uniref:Branched-chain amino acid:cation transporter, LIVCS family n=1 Tax=Pedobacter psychrodurus TaxID=2530456 RepID=A0A4R0PUN1_9SPHI|nr:hypothetical protein [Pedobacter psychrodurus]TCD26249.1 hypothetical protein EZ456_14655 [Pedobacter psychrodurus]